MSKRRDPLLEVICQVIAHSVSGGLEGDGLIKIARRVRSQLPADVEISNVTVAQFVSALGSALREEGFLMKTPVRNVPSREVLSLALTQSYLLYMPEGPPGYFEDFFIRVMTTGEGDSVRLPRPDTNFSFDVPEKLGLVHFAVRQLDATLVPFEGKQVPPSEALSLALVASKYHAYMLFWTTRSLIDALSVRLNGVLGLDYSGNDIYLGKRDFLHAVGSKRSDLGLALGPFETWFDEVDRYRLISIHRHAIPVIPNGDPSVRTDWQVCVPRHPEGSLQSLIDGKLVELVPLRDLARRWASNASDVCAAVVGDATKLRDEGAQQLKWFKSMMKRVLKRTRTEYP
jgi:hypothetical protein